MLHKAEFPVLEYDDERQALLGSGERRHELPGDRLVISFFAEAIDQLLQEGKIEPCRIIGGENKLTVYRFLEDDVLLVHGAIGCPAMGGFLEVLYKLGVQKVMFCGGGGAVEKGIHVGKLFVVEGAIRDEGFSYQYAPPSRVIFANPDVRAKIRTYLEANSIPYAEGLCWTTDCLYRETPERVARRREEGAKVVEMEQAGCIAVAQFRGMDYGAIIYGGDDVSGPKWNKRAEVSRQGIRYELIGLCREIVKTL